MDKKRLYIYGVPALLLAVVFGVNVPTVLGVTSSSNSYKVVESEFGSTSNQESCSGQYCSRASIGDLATGRSESATKTAQFGTLTDSDPVLEVIIDAGESNLGILSTEETATKTTTVRVRNYLSGGYTMQMIGDAPTYDGHRLNTPSTPTAATPGTEQFGVNAAANTTPAIGASPVQVPSDQTSFGVVDINYSIADMFKYASGDIIARSDSESGRTDYTISTIVNIANSTPSGRYAGDYSVVVIPVY